MKKASGGMVALVVIVALLVGVLAADRFGLLSITTPDDPEPTPDPNTPATCDSTTSPTITLSTPSLYTGSTVTTQNLWRQIGFSGSTDVAGAGTITTLSPGDQFEVLWGVDSDDDDAEPYGPHKTYTVDCKEAYTIEQVVIDDSLGTDLTVLAFDPNDGNSITASDSYDVDAGDIDTVQVRWTGAFQEDFGNRWCEDSEGVGNVLVIRYNTTQYDSIKATQNGATLPTAGVPISNLLASSSGFTDVTFEAPVLRSNDAWDFELIVDADDSVNPDGGLSNVTIYLYDVNRFINNDNTPPTFDCGIMDEDNNEVGAAAADSLLIVIEDD